jgi:hypothetical protein
MPLPQDVRDEVERRLEQYCRERFPERVRDQLRLSYRIRGNNVTLVEGRPGLLNPEKWSDMAVAQFRFRPADSKWLLYWADRNSRWHEYDDVEPSDDLDDLLREVDRDPTGIFWG